MVPLRLNEATFAMVHNAMLSRDDLLAAYNNVHPFEGVLVAGYRGLMLNSCFCKCRPACNRSPRLNGGLMRVSPYPHFSSSCAFSPPPPPPATTFRARIILDSATPPAMRGSGILQRYAFFPSLVCPFCNGIVVPTLPLSSHPMRACTTRCPRPPPRLSFFHQVLGNIKMFLDVNRNEVCVCVRVSV
jgi:hypothetical protein